MCVCGCVSFVVHALMYTFMYAYTIDARTHARLHMFIHSLIYIARSQWRVLRRLPLRPVLKHRGGAWRVCPLSHASVLPQLSTVVYISKPSYSMYIFYVAP